MLNKNVKTQALTRAIGEVTKFMARPPKCSGLVRLICGGRRQNTTLHPVHSEVSGQIPDKPGSQKREKKKKKS